MNKTMVLSVGKQPKELDHGLVAQFHYLEFFSQKMLLYCSNTINLKHFEGIMFTKNKL